MIKSQIRYIILTLALVWGMLFGINPSIVHAEDDSNPNNEEIVLTSEKIDTKDEVIVNAEGTNIDLKEEVDYSKLLKDVQKEMKDYSSQELRFTIKRTENKDHLSDRDLAILSVGEQLLHERIVKQFFWTTIAVLVFFTIFLK